MKRVTIALTCMLIFLLGACTLPAPRVPAPQGITQQASQAAVTIETKVEITPTENILATQAVDFTTEALVATLAEPTPAPTSTTTTRLPQIEANPQPTQVTAPQPTFRFIPQSGTPVMTSNFINPGAGCNWMGVGGQVFGKDEKPISGLIAEVEGILNGKPVLFLALTGNSPVLGPGGYEITLANQTVASQGALTLQLYDLNGMPQSDKIRFDTVGGEGSCEKNLTILNFSEIGTVIKRSYFFPYVPKGAPGR